MPVCHSWCLDPPSKQHVCLVSNSKTKIVVIMTKSEKRPSKNQLDHPKKSNRISSSRLQAAPTSLNNEHTSLDSLSDDLIRHHTHGLPEITARRFTPVVP